MKIQSITKANAFSPGKNTWFLPQLNQSKWTRKVDWYLNFVISRADNHKPIEFSEHLQSIIKENELPLELIKIKDNAPYLFASESRLPNQQTVVVNFNEDVSEWIKGIHKVWTDLNKPESRIFLPIELTIDEFKGYWPKTDDDKELDVVIYDN